MSLSNLNLPTGEETLNQWNAFFQSPETPSNDYCDNMKRIIQETADHVKEKLANHDASHDWNHIMRVWIMARRLANEENLSTEVKFHVELAALLHDIADWKYCGDEKAGVNTARSYLLRHTDFLKDEQIDHVVSIINGVGFKDELNNANKEQEKLIDPALACVQDADRLDAIGAIGIARCLTYGGHKKKPLYDAHEPPRKNLTKDQYMASKNDPSINHFYEKLFKLKDMMKTKSGKNIANQRHLFMETFISTFLGEIRTEI